PPGAPLGARPRAIEEAVVELALRKRSLTLALIRSSTHRMEEFARSLVQAVGADVAGESRAESAQKLERLDFDRLRAEADSAREKAETRMEKLRLLQEQAEARISRRGKW